MLYRLALYIYCEQIYYVVFGESTRSRLAARVVHSWRIGDSIIQERDQAKHYGFSVFSIAHISSMVTSARSAFYAIQAVGPRFGLLHPLTPLKLYRAYSLSILSYGLEVISPTKTELVMLMRTQLVILKLILGLSMTTNSMAIHILLGNLLMRLIVARSQLSFLLWILSMDESPSKKVLIFCLSNPIRKSWAVVCSKWLEELCMPSLEDLVLLTSLPSRQCWKRYLFALLHPIVRFEFNTISNSRSPEILQLHALPRIGRPSQLLSCRRGDSTLTRRNNLHVRLIEFCSVYVQFSSRFD